MAEIPEQIERAILDRQLLQHDERLMVGVSGGVDSMVLLHLLHALSQQHGWQLHVLHFNHLLRTESDADEALVKKTAERFTLPVIVDRGDVRKFAEAERLSIEMAARQLRHRFLAKVAKENAIQKIALAHHADDQVELFFLRLLRGTGLDGLGGMEWSSPSPADPQIQLIRPLLECSKAELRDYAARHEIAIREDSTNESLDILRNRIRRELLPLIEQHYQPAITKTTLRLMDIIRGESEWIDSALSTTPSFQEQRFDLIPLALQRRLIQKQVIELGLPPNFDLIEELRQSETPVMVRPETVAYRDASGRVHREAVSRPCFDSDRVVVSLTAEKGTLCFKDVFIEWQIIPASVEPETLSLKPSAGVESFDADKVGDSITLRHWQAGDRFQPIGMSHAVKLQDIFVNQKLSREDRHKLLVAATANDAIVWVEGLRISERFKLDKQSKKLLKWSWRRA